MRKIKLFIPVLICAIAIASCKKDFLDKAPGVDITENTVFSTRANLDLFITTVYKYAMHSLFRYGDQQAYSITVGVNQYDAAGPTGMMCDEGKASEAAYYLTNDWQKGNILSSNIVADEDYRYYIRWTAMRQLNLIMKRANEVVTADPANTPQSYINQVIGECKVLRAMNYLEMIKRYGGVPIVTQVFDAGVQINAPRNSLDSCISFILKDCDDAIANNDLPAVYSASLTGRVTKTVAYVIKAKTLLFAASPQFNTGTPYLSMPNVADNRLICLGSYDVNRWKLAADAAKAAIDYAEANGYAIIDVPANRNPSDTTAAGVPQIPAGNYRNSWSTFDNSEIILAYQGYRALNPSNDPIRLFKPTFADGGTSRSGSTVPLNFFSKYEKIDGTPQTWPATGGSDLLAKYYQLDPRFKQTMCYTRSYYGVLDPNVAIYNGGTPGNVYNNCWGGIWMRKFLPSTGSASVYLNDIIYRVNELYLYWAEALNEYNASPPPEAYSAINKIRTRSAMPNLPTGLTQAQFRDRVRNESAIELVFEDHRLWDIRRWLIAEQDGVMKGDFTGLRINKVSDKVYTWTTWTFETRVFNKNMYLHPFPLPEVLKGNLVQNPGY